MMSNGFKIKYQKSVSKTYKPEDDLSNDGLLWFNDALMQLTQRQNDELNPKQKFRIKIEKVE